MQTMSELGARFLCCYVQSFCNEDRERVCYICHKPANYETGRKFALASLGEWLLSGQAVFSILPSVCDDECKDRDDLLGQLSSHFIVQQMEPCVIAFDSKFSFRLEFMKRQRLHQKWNLVSDAGVFHCNSFRFLRLFHFKFRVPKKLGIYRNKPIGKHDRVRHIEQAGSQDERPPTQKRRKGHFPIIDGGA
jgi:hypothetical protein